MESIAGNGGGGSACPIERDPLSGGRDKEER